GGNPSASDYGKYAMIGHGGAAARTGSMSGSVTVEAEGDIAMNGGTGGDGFVQIGHGGRTHGGAKGAAGDLVKVVSHGGSLTMKGGEGSRAHAMIGMGGQDSGGTVLGSVDVDVENAIVMESGDGVGAFTLIGHG